MIKIAVTGPESSGKTSLAKHISKFFSLKLVSEYAREFLNLANGKYTESDLLLIAKEQYKQNHLETLSGKGLVADTELTVISVWSQDKFGKIDPLIEQLRKKEKFDLYLLCYPDLPWEPDPLREDPFRRIELFENYLTFLDNANANYSIIKGENREKQAENHINKLYSSYL